ncbi:hypothetical protein AKJ16_DCAP08828 [Drosera capensis]
MGKTQAQDNKAATAVPTKNPGYPTEESSTMKVEKKKKGWFRSLMPWPECVAALPVKSAAAVAAEELKNKKRI